MIRDHGWLDGVRIARAGGIWTDGLLLPLPCLMDAMGRRAKLEWAHYLDGYQRGFFGYGKVVNKHVDD